MLSRVKRISGSKNFRSPPEKDFCNNIPPKAEVGGAVACPLSRTECLTVGTAAHPTKSNPSPRQPGDPVSPPCRRRNRGHVHPHRSQSMAVGISEVTGVHEVMVFYWIDVGRAAICG